MALSGDTALVGADGENDYQGAAYVFTRSGTTWTQQKLTASDGAAGDWFGASVALSGDTALVGAFSAAYVFTRSGTTWTQQAKLTALDGAAAMTLASRWRSRATRPWWGRPAMMSAQMTRQGSAYVFTRSGTTWMQQAKLTASDGAAE